MNPGRERGLQSRTAAALRSLGAKVVIIHGDMFTPDGTPDIIGSLRGRCFVIEMKTKTGNTSALQNVDLEEWKKAGAVAFVARSVQEAVTRIRTEILTDDGPV